MIRFLNQPIKPFLILNITNLENSTIAFLFHLLSKEQLLNIVSWQQRVICSSRRYQKFSSLFPGCRASSQKLFRISEFVLGILVSSFFVNLFPDILSPKIPHALKMPLSLAISAPTQACFEQLMLCNCISLPPPQIKTCIYLL